MQQLQDIVGSSGKLNSESLIQLKHGGWIGNGISRISRGIYWRLMLGTISRDGAESWSKELQQQLVDYKAIKASALPDVNRVQLDPLSGASHEGWDNYYKDLEIVSFIKGDLERLYMNGVDDEYFKTSAHQNLLLNILFIWVTRHRQTGYRQGMHEIAAPVLLVLQQEREEWAALLAQTSVDGGADGIGYGSPCSVSADLLALGSCFTLEHLEASTFWIYERIMEELEPLYSPVTGVDEQPTVVHYCTRIQEHMLRGLDPELCVHLEDTYIQAQLYGMRWARLMLGREFQCNEKGLLRLWDYMFACVLHHSMQQEQQGGAEGGGEPKTSTNEKGRTNKTKHPLGEDDNDEDYIWTTTSAAMKASLRVKQSSPLLEALGDFMLAMLLHIRSDLMRGDSSATMTLLMRYPLLEDVTPIVDLADMIRRGVLDAGAHMGACMRPDEVFKPPSYEVPVDVDGNFDYRTDKRQFTGKSGWLLGLGSNTIATGNKSESPVRDLNPSYPILHGVGKRMSATLSAVGSVFNHEDASGLLAAKKRTSDQSITSPGPATTVSSRRPPADFESSYTSSPVEQPTPTKLQVMEGLNRDVSTTVSRQLTDIAVYLEKMTTSCNPEAIESHMPDVVSRLRFLSSVLSGSASLSDFDDVYGELRTYEPLYEGSPSAESPLLVDSSADGGKDEMARSSTRQTKFSFDSDDSVNDSINLTPPVTDAVFDNCSSVPIDPEFMGPTEQISPVQVVYQQRKASGTVSRSLPKKLALNSTEDSPL